MSEMDKQLLEDAEKMYFASKNYDNGTFTFDYDGIKNCDDFDLDEFVSMLKYILTRGQCIEVLRKLVSKSIISLEEYKQVLQNQLRDFKRPRFSSTNSRSPFPIAIP